MFERVWKRDIFDSEDFKGKYYIFLLLKYTVHIVYLSLKRKLARCACIEKLEIQQTLSTTVAMGLVHFSGLGLERCCLCTVLTRQHKQHRNCFCYFVLAQNSKSFLMSL